MSLIILGDTHFGASNSSPIVHANMKKFYTDFFQYIDDHSIKTVLQLGDLFDVRKHINTWSLNFFREVFLKPCIERNLKVIVLLGNHDIFYRESLQISSVEEVLTPYSEWFTIVREPTDMRIAGKEFLLVPWVCRENATQVSAAIEESDATYCAGHFEFNGFELFRGQLAKTHHTHDAYKKFDKVFSGHYHHMSSKDNVLYTGTPYELTWQDCNTTKGFFVLQDDSTLELVENPHSLYASFQLSKVDLFTEDLVKEKHVRITVDVPLEPKEREALLDRIHSMKPHSVKLIETKLDASETSNVTYAPTTTVTELITDYIDNITVNQSIDKSTLSNILMNLYVEASA